MSIYGALKNSALQIIKAQKTQDIPIGVLFDKFEALATPAAVLALIADVEGLRAQHGRDSAELRSLCQARDDARKERDQLKAEVEALRKDAERYRWLRNPSDSVVVRDLQSHLRGDYMDKRIDAAMSKGDHP